jgi:hypothetical protein
MPSNEPVIKISTTPTASNVVFITARCDACGIRAARIIEEDQDCFGTVAGVEALAHEGCPHAASIIDASAPSVRTAKSG